MRTSPSFRILLDHGGNVDARTSEGAATPLMRACTAGHANVALLLLGRRASPSLCDNDGETPLHKAAKEGRTEVVKLLLELPVNACYPLPLSLPAAEVHHIPRSLMLFVFGWVQRIPPGRLAWHGSQGCNLPLSLIVRCSSFGFGPRSGRALWSCRQPWQAACGCGVGGGSISSAVEFACGGVTGPFAADLVNLLQLQSSYVNTGTGTGTR